MTRQKWATSDLALMLFVDFWLGEKVNEDPPRVTPWSFLAGAQPGALNNVSSPGADQPRITSFGRVVRPETQMSIMKRPVRRRGPSWTLRTNGPRNGVGGARIALLPTLSALCSLTTRLPPWSLASSVRQACSAPQSRSPQGGTARCRLAVPRPSAQLVTPPGSRSATEATACFTTVTSRAPKSIFNVMKGRGDRPCRGLATGVGHPCGVRARERHGVFAQTPGFKLVSREVYRLPIYRSSPDDCRETDFVFVTIFEKLRQNRLRVVPERGWEAGSPRRFTASPPRDPLFTGGGGALRGFDRL